MRPAREAIMQTAVQRTAPEGPSPGDGPVLLHDQKSGQTEKSAMNTDRVRIITEKLPLADCRKGDEVDIHYSHNGSWKSVGRGTLEKIKDLPKGGHQIKLRGTGSRDTIQKHDVPAGVVVTRRRKATEADGPDAGTIESQTEIIDGVRYVSTNPNVDIMESARLAVTITSHKSQGGTYEEILERAIRNRLNIHFREHLPEMLTMRLPGGIWPGR